MGNYLWITLWLFMIAGNSLLANETCMKVVEREETAAATHLEKGSIEQAAKRFATIAEMPCIKSRPFDYREVLFYVGSLYAQINNDAKALEYLDKAVKAGYFKADKLEETESFDSFRHLPVFAALLAQTRANARILPVNYDKVLEIPFSNALSTEAKIAGLSKFWTEVKYNFAFFDQTNVNWDALYLEMIPKVTKATTTAAYYKLLAAMCRQLKDGHTNVSLPDALAPKYYAKPLIWTRLVENKVIVTHIWDETLKDDQFQIGTEIVKIDGIPVKTYAQERVSDFYLMTSTDHDEQHRRYSYGLLAGDIEKPVRLACQNANGKPFSRVFKRVMERGSLPTLSFEKRQNIGIVTINSFSDSKLESLWEDQWQNFKDTEGLIIDLRNNGGGNTPNWLVQQFMDKPFSNNLWRSRMHVPSYRAWGSGAAWFEGNATKTQPNLEKQYTKPVVVLVGPATFSAAEDLASTLQALERATLIGEPTGGSTGQPLYFSLPGGGSARVCTKRDTTIKGTEFVGVGVQPDIKISRKISDYREGKDYQLTEALSFLKKQAK